MFYDSKIVVLPKTPNPYKLTGLMIIIFLIIGSAVSYYGLSTHEAELRAATDRQSEEVLSLKERKARLDENIGKFEGLIDQFNKALFKEKDISLFLTGISELSKTNNVNVLSIRNLPEETIIIGDETETRGKTPALARKTSGVNITISPLEVTIEGEMDDVLAVLLALERTPQLLAITEFHFSLKQYPRINTKFRINLYGSWKEGRS